MAVLMILRTLAGYALGGDAFSEADRLHLLIDGPRRVQMRFAARQPMAPA